jgi:hypothetical protein
MNVIAFEYKCRQLQLYQMAECHNYHITFSCRSDEAQEEEEEEYRAFPEGSLVQLNNSNNTAATNKDPLSQTMTTTRYEFF